MVPQNMEKSFKKQIETMENLFWKLLVETFLRNVHERILIFLHFQLQ